MRRLCLAFALLPACATAAVAEDLAAAVAAVSSHLAAVGEYHADAYIKYT